MELKLMKVNELDNKKRERVNAFITSPNSTGEFINSMEYLAYHGDRFREDSVVVFDVPSWNVKGVLLATQKDGEIIVSHSGTTFAGPIVNMKDSYHTQRDVICMMLEYYEAKYKEIHLKTIPHIYLEQPTEIVEYILQQRKYVCEMTGLSNVVSLGKVNREEDLLKIYTVGRRNQVKKVMKSEKFVFEQKKEISRKIWDHMNGILKEKFSSKTTHSYEEIVELQSRFPERIVPYEVRTNRGEYAAFALVYKFKNVMHTQYLDVNYSFTGENPNRLLIHKLILEAKKEGFSVFSFGASTEDGGKYLNEGLYSYKNGYGGGSVLLPVYKKKVN